MRTVPEGVDWLLMRNAVTSWSGLRLCSLRSSGSTLITIVRALPPNGAEETNPCTDVKLARTYTLARSCSSLLLRVGLLRISWPTGKVEASKRMIKGGLDPGGKITCARLLNAVTSAAAWAILVPG